MKNKWVFVVCVTLIFALVFLWQALHEERPVSTIPDNVQIPVQPPTPVIPAIVQKINSRNSSIKSLAAPNATFKVFDRGLSVPLKGSIYLEKERNFRIFIRSIFGEEVDIGSNDKQFWFWSKRVRPFGLYFAAHEDFEKTMLKDPYHPIWIRDGFGLSEIDLTKGELQELSSQWLFVQHIKSGAGLPLKKVIFIGKKSERIEGQLLYDRNGKLIASGEVQEYTPSGLPKKLYYIWKEENSALLVDLGQPVINGSIDSKYWRLPDVQPQFDMSK